MAERMDKVDLFWIFLVRVIGKALGYGMGSHFHQ